MGSFVYHCVAGTMHSVLIKHYKSLLHIRFFLDNFLFATQMYIVSDSERLSYRYTSYREMATVAIFSHTYDSNL